MKKKGVFKRALYKLFNVESDIDRRVNAAITTFSDAYNISLSGQSVTTSKSLQVSAVWACVRLLAETISTLPLKLHERQEDGSLKDATDYALWRTLCIEPNKQQTPSKMLEFLVASLALRGNAYFEKRMVADRVRALIPLLPQNLVKIEKLENGEYQYRFLVEGKEEIFPEKDIWHIRGFGLDGLTGLDSLSVGKETIGSAMASNEAAATFFEKGMSVSGALSVDQALTDEQREKLKANLSGFSGSKNAGKLMVLEHGMKYQGISLAPEQSQLLESRGYGVEEICRLFKVPPILVYHMSKQSSWASSVESVNRQFLTYTLLPIIKNIEESIVKSLIPPQDRDRIFPKFNYEGFLRANSEERASFYNSALSNGWMSRNEVRAKEDLPPIEGGDIFTIQSALIPVEKVGTNYEKKTQSPQDESQE